MGDSKLCIGSHAIVTEKFGRARINIAEIARNNFKKNELGASGQLREIFGLSGVETKGNGNEQNRRKWKLYKGKLKRIE